MNPHLNLKGFVFGMTPPPLISVRFPMVLLVKDGFWSSTHSCCLYNLPSLHFFQSLVLSLAHVLVILVLVLVLVVVVVVVVVVAVGMIVVAVLLAVVATRVRFN